MMIVGEDQKTIVWEGPTTFVPEQTYFVLAGFSNSLGDSARVVYVDSEGGNDFSILSDYLKFNFAP